MKVVTIHLSGEGADRLEVMSCGNGWAYSVQYGGDGHPMRTLWLQDDDATFLRNEIEAWEELYPEWKARDIWDAVLKRYSDIMENAA